VKKFVTIAVILGLISFGNVYSANFGVNSGTEDFEGTTFPPAGWQVTCSSTGYGCWARGTDYASGAGFSGYNAQSIYGDYLLDTSLITPTFSTEGFTQVNVEFDGYFYFYDGYGNKCDLQYTTDGGSNWVTLKTWGTYGSPTTESIALPAEALGQPNVMLRWHRYASSYPYYYAVVDNVRLTGQLPAQIPTMNGWGMIILSLLMAASALWIVRRRRQSA
jgi:hypothetical protein